MWNDRFFEEWDAALAPHLFLRAVILTTLAAVLVLLVTAADAQVPDAARAFKRQYIAIVHSEWGLDAPVPALAAQIEQESSWNCRAISRVGARGCAQFMPSTADWIGSTETRLAGGDAFAPSWAFRAQAYYMRWLFDRVRGRPDCERMAFAFSAYNGGLAWVYRRQKLSGAPERCMGATCDINPGITSENQRENARYPRRILLELEPRYVAAAWGEETCNNQEGK